MTTDEILLLRFAAKEASQEDWQRGMWRSHVVAICDRILMLERGLREIEACRTYRRGFREPPPEVQLRIRAREILDLDHTKPFFGDPSYVPRDGSEGEDT